MKPGNRVELTIDMDDLKQGSKGICVVAKDNASKHGVITPMIWTGYSIDVIAVHFDGREGPSIARMVNDKYTMVKDHCHVIN